MGGQGHVFGTPWDTKNEVFAKDIQQKSHVGLVGNRKCLGMDFGSDFDGLVALTMG